MGLLNSDDWITGGVAIPIYTVDLLGWMSFRHVSNSAQCINIREKQYIQLLLSDALTHQCVLIRQNVCTVHAK